MSASVLVAVRPSGSRKVLVAADCSDDRSRSAVACRVGIRSAVARLVISLVLRYMLSFDLARLDTLTSHLAHITPTNFTTTPTILVAQTRGEGQHEVLDRRRSACWPASGTVGELLSVNLFEIELKLLLALVEDLQKSTSHTE